MVTYYDNTTIFLKGTFRCNFVEFSIPPKVRNKKMY